MDKDLNEFNEHLGRLNRRLAEPLSAEEEQLLRDWVTQHPLQQDAANNEPDQLAAKGAGIYNDIDREINSSLKPTRLYLLRLLKIAAMVAGVCLLGAIAYWNSHRHSSRKFTILRNDTKMPRKFVLPDGSVIWLNKQTRIRTDEHFGRNNRELYLEEGEAFVDVKQNETLPFLVKTGEVSIAVLGTSFNVKAYTATPVIKITVLTGKVRVDKNSQQLQQLNQDDELVYNRAYASFSLHKVEARKVSGWKDGGLYLEDVPFPEFVKALQERYGVYISYPEQLQQQKIHIYILHHQPLQDVMEMIGSIYNIQYSTNGKNVTISLKGTR